ncbi:c-type cytochrome [Vreelandella sp. 21]|uniref:C-type cytochrome n=1 Tax=Vreelandella alkaliphila TaxID=272774 RepID=A0AAJ2VNY0_9GAMM|nr:c-type cytochrome [Halomonas alkaliphila]AIA74419.1 cytochrome C [Halomonas campaniensis]AYF35734.1 cytochrome c5 family protein [Halomonas alkaliphila]MDX5977952.1 c-type cytochrome [Halomonas alkaliphila]
MKSKLIMSGLAALGVMAGTSGAYAQDAARDAIAERLAPVGQLCLQGQDCGTAAAPAAASGGGDEIDGEGIYNNICMACHETGAAGAPVRADEAAWAERTEQGFATLLEHAINGIGAMPARGGNPNLSDEEMEAAVAYMVEPVMEVPELGGGEEEAAAEATEEGASDDTAVTEDAGEETTDAAASEEEAVASEDEASSGGSGLDGEALYASAGCVACHAAGVAGAPKLGDAEAWGPRIEQGTDALYQSVFNGKGVMPPRGGSSASDEEIMAVVDYMVSQAQ